MTCECECSHDPQCLARLHELRQSAYTKGPGENSFHRNMGAKILLELAVLFKRIASVRKFKKTIKYVEAAQCKTTLICINSLLAVSDV